MTGINNVIALALTVIIFNYYIILHYIYICIIDKLLRGKMKKHGQESVPAEKIDNNNCCDMLKQLKDMETDYCKK